MYIITHIWNLKTKTNKCSNKTNRLTDIENKPVGRGKEEEQDRGIRLRDTKYLYIK